MRVVTNCIVSRWPWHSNRSANFDLHLWNRIRIAATFISESKVRCSVLDRKSIKWSLLEWRDDVRCPRTCKDGYFYAYEASGRSRRFVFHHWSLQSALRAYFSFIEISPIKRSIFGDVTNVTTFLTTAVSHRKLLFLEFISFFKCFLLCWLMTYVMWSLSAILCFSRGWSMR